MKVIYSVGLYCHYEGGTPSMYFHTESDAQAMVAFLEKYSLIMTEIHKQEDYTKLEEIRKIEKEFKATFGEDFKLYFPWKSSNDYEKFEIQSHPIMSLDSNALSILQSLTQKGS